MKRLLTLGLVVMSSVAFVGCGADVNESKAPTPTPNKEDMVNSIKDMEKHMQKSAGSKGGYGGLDAAKVVDEAAKRNAEGGN
jgi:hypothetical protein